MADPLFEVPRLAQVYDPFDPDRSDLEAYLALVEGVDAHTVLDVGCGTGTFACLLAQRGLEVIGVDPAQASLEIARRKPGADRVRWLHGDATTLPPVRADLATLTGNVAQVFLTDDAWDATLLGIAEAVRPDGWLAFETRVPEREAWRSWNRDESRQQIHAPGVGAVERWVDVTDAIGPFVTFRATFVFASDGEVLTSESTLRFRTRSEVQDSLERCGFRLLDVRDAPDRPGLEHVFLAQRRISG